MLKNFILFQRKTKPKLCWLWIMASILIQDNRRPIVSSLLGHYWKRAYIRHFQNFGNYFGFMWIFMLFSICTFFHKQSAIYDGKNLYNILDGAAIVHVENIITHYFFGNSMRIDIQIRYNFHTSEWGIGPFPKYDHNKSILIRSKPTFHTKIVDIIYL